jgi:hypothetical protein
MRHTDKQLLFSTMKRRREVMLDVRSLDARIVDASRACDGDRLKVGVRGFIKPYIFVWCESRKRFELDLDATPPEMVPEGTRAIWLTKAPEKYHHLHGTVQLEGNRFEEWSQPDSAKIHTLDAIEAPVAIR